MDKYASFFDLAAGEREGRDYRRTVTLRRDSAYAIVAPHGGGIEPGTSEIAYAIAGQEFSLYSLEGTKPSDNQCLHIASEHFDDPQCIQVISMSEGIVAIHGCEGEDRVVFVGGRDEGLRDKIIEALKRKGIRAEPDSSAGHPGSLSTNICNRGRQGKGVQLEITEGLRLDVFKGLKRQERKQTMPLFDDFVSTVRKGLMES